MKTALLLMACLAIACLCVHAQNQNRDFERLDLMVGTWKMESGKGILYESWRKINDSTLKGRSFKINGKDTVLLEQVDLIKTGGEIQYIPVVNGQNNDKAVIFALSKTENGIYIFENSNHDFPQRIVYALPEANVLHAWIEGNMNGKFRRVDYKYTRLL
jgi:hypothetical protein